MYPHIKVLVFFISFVFASYYGFGQKANSFNLKLHQYNYPDKPLPNTCTIYGISAQVGNKSIITRDYRGDLLVLHDLKVFWGGYDPGDSGYEPKLFSFDKYHKSPIPYKNGFVLKIEMDDVELYHEYTGEGDVYEIRGDYEYRLAVTHKDQLVASDTLKYQEVLGSFTSTLPAKDVHIIATNKATEFAINLNDQILKSSVWAFRSFVSNAIDLSFTKEYIKFYGITKSKKLVSREQVKELHNRLKNLEALDENFIKRDTFYAAVDLLIADFLTLKVSEDYSTHDSFKFYVNANLASLNALIESYFLVETFYETALSHNHKVSFDLIVEEELRKSNYRRKNKKLMFNQDGSFKDHLSQNYLNYYNTRKRANN